MRNLQHALRGTQETDSHLLYVPATTAFQPVSNYEWAELYLYSPTCLCGIDRDKFALLAYIFLLKPRRLRRRRRHRHRHLCLSSSSFIHIFTSTTHSFTSHSSCSSWSPPYFAIVLSPPSFSFIVFITAFLLLHPLDHHLPSPSSSWSPPSFSFIVLSPPSFSSIVWHSYYNSSESPSRSWRYLLSFPQSQSLLAFSLSFPYLSVSTNCLHLTVIFSA